MCCFSILGIPHVCHFELWPMNASLLSGSTADVEMDDLSPVFSSASQPQPPPPSSPQQAPPPLRQRRPPAPMLVEVSTSFSVWLYVAGMVYALYAVLVGN